MGFAPADDIVGGEPVLAWGGIGIPVRDIVGEIDRMHLLCFSVGGDCYREGKVVNKEMEACQAFHWKAEVSG